MNVNATAVNKTARGSLLTRCKTPPPPRPVALERKSSHDSATIRRISLMTSVVYPLPLRLPSRYRGSLLAERLMALCLRTNPPRFASACALAAEDDVALRNLAMSARCLSVAFIGNDFQFASLLMQQRFRGLVSLNAREI